jgi:Trypsin
VDVGIERIINHPDYKVDKKYNDISLLKLKHSVEFSFRVWPACLNTESDRQESLFIAGFGRNSTINGENQ